VRDVVQILTRRFPNVHLTLHPVHVQGEGAAEEIVEALHCFNKRFPVDVILLVRGGGSLEDLWEFNEEVLARAIAASSIPVICGVGHETDFTIADFVSDIRASTPSAAAELVVQTRREFDKHVADLRDSLESLLRYRLMEFSRKVHELGSRKGFHRPLDLLRQRRQRADELTARLAVGLRGRLETSRRRFTTAQLHVARFNLRAKIGGLHLRAQRCGIDLGVRVERIIRGKRERLGRVALRLQEQPLGLLRDRSKRVGELTLQLQERSPLKVLERGYAIATDASGHVVRDADQVAIGSELIVQLHRGRLNSEVKKKEV
jgi:exodeoxyribonuclease VII large subunit